MPVRTRPPAVLTHACIHCGELGQAWECLFCGTAVSACCESCHDELVHNVLHCVTDGKPGPPSARRHREGDEAGGAQENAIREMEDGGLEP